MSGAYEVERARHEREALERDQAERERARAKHEAAQEAEIADRRAELESRINVASKEASDETLARFRKAAAQELSKAQEDLEVLVSNPVPNLVSMYVAYEAMLTATERLSAVGDYSSRVNGRAPIKSEPVSFESILQSAATNRARSAGREFGFQLEHEIGQASLEAAAKVRDHG